MTFMDKSGVATTDVTAAEEISFTGSGSVDTGLNTHASNQKGEKETGYAPAEAGVKQKIAGLLNAVRYLRIPLIFINILAVFFEILLG